MDEEWTKDKRYRIIHYIKKDSGSYFESDTTWYWEVEDVLNKKLLEIFVESDYANASGRQQSGASLVKFSEDQGSVIVEYYDGSIESINLKTKKKTKIKDAEKAK